MNFLAHIYLSGNSEKLIIGNFIGDAVKGTEYLSYHPEIIRGIKLHRKIDEFTDCHPVVIESKNRLRPEYGKYSSVIVDIFYDHFLAASWDKYSETPLHLFAGRIYQLINENLDWMPPKVKHFLPYMVSGNWLLNYAHMDGIRSTLKGMSRRARFESKMEQAADDLQKDYDLYKNEFELFFPQLRDFVKVL
jgi:acyl carrier protein phosphodiesterase